MTVAIISSCYGDYDPVAVPLEQTIPVEWIFVSDRPHEVAGWRQVIEARPHLHPRMAAKIAKCRPDWYTDADVTIWIDASFQILRTDFAEWCVDQLGNGHIAQIRHPERQSIVDEAAVSMMMEKYQGQPCREQAVHYVRHGHPDGWGLWATGLIVRRSASSAARYFGASWLSEQMRWSYQDQISEPPVLRCHDLFPVDLQTPLWRSDFFAIRQHRSAA